MNIRNSKTLNHNVNEVCDIIKDKTIDNKFNNENIVEKTDTELNKEVDKTNKIKFRKNRDSLFDVSHIQSRFKNRLADKIISINPE